MFDQILVPVDGSLLAENILPHAIRMAIACHSAVTLISILDPLVGIRSTGPTEPLDWQIQRAEVESYLQDLSSRFQSRGLTARTICLDGKAAERVIHHSTSTGTNLIMLSSHGQGGVSRWNNSSVVTKILQQANTSVMIIRSLPTVEQAPATLRYKRILVPVDGSLRAEYGLFAAAHLAREHKAELILTHVIKPPELPRRTPLSVKERALIQQVIESNRDYATQYLNNLKAHLDCKVDTCLLISDSVTEALHSLVEQESIDLIVLNAHGLGANPRWRFGNVAVNFLAYSAIPLLIVQDFAQDLLVKKRADPYANEFMGGIPMIVDEARPNFWRASQ